MLIIFFGRFHIKVAMLSSYDRKPLFCVWPMKPKVSTPHLFREKLTSPRSKWASVFLITISSACYLMTFTRGSKNLNTDSVFQDPFLTLWCYLWSVSLVGRFQSCWVLSINQMLSQCHSRVSSCLYWFRPALSRRPLHRDSCSSTDLCGKVLLNQWDPPLHTADHGCFFSWLFFK